MCVIVYKPEGKPMPSKSTLHDCWDRNSDGAGFAYLLDGKVCWAKGFMNWKAFWKAFREIPEAARDNDVIAHFRIATHSVKDGGNTHPFPVTTDPGEMRKLSGETTDTILFHNGVISTPVDPLLSDTMIFVRDVVAKHTALFMDPAGNALALKLMLGGSKLALMSPGAISLVGDWHEEDGCYFSNTYYKPIVYARGNADTYYGRYDWDGFNGGRRVASLLPNDRLCCYCKHVGVIPRPAQCNGCFGTVGKAGFEAKDPKDAIQHVCGTCHFSDTDTESEPCVSCMDASVRGSRPRWSAATVKADKADKADKAASGDEVEDCSTCYFEPRASNSLPCLWCLGNQNGKDQPKYWQAKDSKTVKPFGVVTRACSYCIHLDKLQTEEPCVACFSLAERPKFEALEEGQEDATKKTSVVAPPRCITCRFEDCGVHSPTCDGCVDNMSLPNWCPKD